jgi:hypothetical protein
LREGRFIPFQVKNRPAHAGLREEGLGIKNRISISLVAAWAFEAGKALQFRLWRVLREVRLPSAISTGHIMS